MIIELAKVLDSLDEKEYSDLGDYYKGVKDVLNVIYGREKLKDFLEYLKINKTTINKNQKLKIHFSEEDLHDLQNGDTFDWTFTTDKGEDIDIHLYQGDDEDYN